MNQSELKRWLSYDSATGIFTWIMKPSKRVCVGDVAGRTRKSDGYVEIGLNKKQYLAHRLAWLYVYGEWPICNIDHRRGLGNDIENLRECRQWQNCQNQTVYRNSASGLIGAISSIDYRCDPPRLRHRAQIRVNGRYYHLGSFTSAIDAHEAYLKAKKKLHKFNPIPRDLQNAG